MKLIQSNCKGQLPSPNSKALGAYYTDSLVADFLASWAIREKNDTVMDPCFGGGVFLRSACKRLELLEGDINAQVFGVEVDADVHRQMAPQLANELEIVPRRLSQADFFSIDPDAERLVNAIIGNPPYIRYQRFSGAARSLALRRSELQGVRLPELCSSWAPFLVHCTAMLRPAGRLAMVLPMELTHAKYARPVLAHLKKSFGKISLITFREKLFPDLNEDTLLLLAEDRGGTCAKFSLKVLQQLGELPDLFDDSQRSRSRFTEVDAESLAGGGSRFLEYLMPPRAKRLYNELKASSSTDRLGDLAELGIGYVTGANQFFHLSPDDARMRRIPLEFLKLSVRRGRAFSGLVFTKADWQTAADQNEASFLLHIARGSSLPVEVKKYIAWGDAQGISAAYKCRKRSPWFCVPHVHKADAFVSYMSGASPRLVVNKAAAFSSNSLHVLRVRPLSRKTPEMLAALWMTSLSRLSAEIEGHPLGGGMLKLEPTEAKNVLLASVDESTKAALGVLVKELDCLIRSGKIREAQQRADETILQGMLGFSQSDCKLLRSATDVLRARRGYFEGSNGAA
ncbi:MAG TPA: N-6 DNA methylase [Pirellulales bacterium]|jgi:adenine-specific DNA methylase